MFLGDWTIGNQQDEGVGIIHKRTVADKVDYSDFIVGLHDREHDRLVAVRGAGIA